MEFVKQNASYKEAKREKRLTKWIASNQIFSVVITFTIFFSILNIALIVNFFKILSNF